MKSRRCFSAPGKALLAGGYLVLDAENSSFVTALSARIYAITSSVNVSSSGNSVITVSSPQFLEGEWSYGLDRNDETGFVLVTPVNPSRRNPFVVAAINTVINYLASIGSFAEPIPSLNITILSDNAYHSQPNDSVPRFNNHSAPITSVPKTGLGSSAALTTSIAAALMAFYADYSLDTLASKSVLHNLAQVAHCTAQGKVGSGFDVACAVYGSIVYRRFAPSYISSLPTLPASSALAEQAAYLKALRSTVEASWNIGIGPCAIPLHFRLLMGDVSGGSETPAMVQMVQLWRKEGGEAAALVWKSLSQANDSLIAAMIDIGHQAEAEPAGYEKFVDEIRSFDSKRMKEYGLSRGDKLGIAVSQAIDAISDIRANLRAMTAGSGAQIEPVEQTQLLDTCSTIPGVLGGVVPGAGGYDAICLLVLEAALDDIIQLKEGQLANVKWLDLREEAMGVREESLSEISKYL